MVVWSGSFQGQIQNLLEFFQGSSFTTAGTRLEFWIWLRANWSLQFWANIERKKNREECPLGFEGLTWRLLLSVPTIRLGASLGYTWSESELESSLAEGSHVTGKARLDLRLLTFAIGSARLPCSCDLHGGAPFRWPATCFWLGSSLNRAALLPCFHDGRAYTLPAASSYSFRT
ncbi:hypothetical protein VNO77_19294 [Canavalia gladiata]|uniref:Uncharacterized protein n=1 Tax=Canavalia gladiata TaxID=3824 RepID=A0AAN9LM83_CANGL